MTRETRIALLVGLAFIVLFGLVLGQRSLNLQNQSNSQNLTRSLVPGTNTVPIGAAPPAYVPPAQPSQSVAPVPAPVVAAHGPQGGVAPELRNEATPPPPHALPVPSNVAPAPVAQVPPAPAPNAPTGAASPGNTPVAVGPAPSNPPVAGSALPPSRIRVDVAGTVDTSKPPALRQDMHELMPAPAVAGVTYKVQSGDTLYKIAHKIYGAGHEAEYTKIYKANQSKIPASFALTVGAELVIPDAPADSAAAATPAAPTAPKNGLKDLTASGKKDASIGELKKAVKGTTDAPAVASNPDSSVLRTPESPAAQNTKATAISTKDLKGKLAPGSGDATVSAAAKKYVIKSGDSLMQIARNQMGDSSKASVQKLLEANKDRIKDPRQLKIGTELRIPQA